MQKDPYDEVTYMADQSMRRGHAAARAEAAVEMIAGEDWPVLQLFYDACRADTWDLCKYCEWGWCEPQRLF